MDTILPYMAHRAAGVLFAEDFDFEDTTPPSDCAPEPELIAPHFTADDIEIARNLAWAEGRDAGLAEASANQAATVARALETLSTALRDSAHEARSAADQAADGIARLLMESMAAMLPEFCASHGEKEIQAVIAAILPALRQEPSVAIRIHPRIARAVQAELVRLDPDLSGRVNFIPSEGMTLGDVRITWEDGAASRDAAEIWRSISAILCSAGLLSPETDVTGASNGR